MKTRNLTRKSLDELAKVMPALSEDVQYSYIAGTHYYDLDGNYLGKIGTSDDLRFIDKQLYENYLIAASTFEYGGETFANTSEHTQKLFLSKKTGIPVDKIQISTGSEYIAGITNLGNLRVNPSGSFWDTNTNATSTSGHEQEHYSSGDYQLQQNSIGLAKAEIRTYENQINRPEYENTTKEYKEETANGLFYWYQEAYKITKDDTYNINKDGIRKKCGL